MFAGLTNPRIAASSAEHWHSLAPNLAAETWSVPGEISLARPGPCACVPNPVSWGVEQGQHDQVGLGHRWPFTYDTSFAARTHRSAIAFSSPFIASSLRSLISLYSYNTCFAQSTRSTLAQPTIRFDLRFNRGDELIDRPAAIIESLEQPGLASCLLCRSGEQLQL